MYIEILAKKSAQDLTHYLSIDGIIRQWANMQ